MTHARPASAASRRVQGFGETVFSSFTALAKEHSAINLGQGFPDFDPPAFALDALREAAADYQQYAPSAGMPRLLDALAAKLSPALGRALEPQRELLVTVGATEALFAAMQALVDSGDEVVLIEPFYDAYPAAVTMAGGVPVYVPLRPQENGSWGFDLDELEAAFSLRTKLVVVNSPHNPTGKVFTEGELDAVVALAERWDALLVSDEVYEHIVFDRPHLSLASRPGAWERTVTISSVGKTFSVTGWKIGWAVGPVELVHALKMAHQWIPFAVATPLQNAAAAVLERAEAAGYYAELGRMYARKRALLLKALAGGPFKAMTPEGSYFVMADASALGFKDDVALCTALPELAGVAAIPPSAFYSEEHKHLAKDLVRFAFCKRDEALLEAGARLRCVRG